MLFSKSSHHLPVHWRRVPGIESEEKSKGKKGPFFSNHHFPPELTLHKPSASVHSHPFEVSSNRLECCFPKVPTIFQCIGGEFQASKVRKNQREKKDLFFPIITSLLSLHSTNQVQVCIPTHLKCLAIDWNAVFQKFPPSSSALEESSRHRK